jgi:hypothetical protein
MRMIGGDDDDGRTTTTSSMIVPNHPENAEPLPDVALLDVKLREAHTAIRRPKPPWSSEELGREEKI